MKFNGINHLAMATGDMDAAGFNCSDVIDHGFIHSIYAFDPNGIPIV